MTDTRIPELITAVADAADWFAHHDDLPEISSATFRNSASAQHWTLDLHLYAVGDKEVLGDLVRFAEALDGPIAIDAPRAANGGPSYRYAHVNAEIGEQLAVEVWGYVRGPLAERVT